MKQDIKERWVTALRSGEYKQCRGMMSEWNKPEDYRDARAVAFCCLGVLDEILEHPTHYPHVADLSESEIEQAVQMNDVMLYDFNQIAAVIERDF